MDIAAAVERGDLDELQRVVDACCETRDWDALEELRDRSARAFERGRQLSAIAARAEYRLALEAPAERAAQVLVEGSGRFALGPLPEVAASTHSWRELAPHVESGPQAVITLHERVVRGEDCSEGPLPGPPVLELPRRLASWEPAYALAEYRADDAAFPAPDPPALAAVELSDPPVGGRDAVVDALIELAAAWTDGSDGRADAVVVEGAPLDAIAALGMRSARIARVDARDAVARMAWTAASGGAHGRRPGAAAGRFSAWWTVAALAGRLDAWPAEPDPLGRTVEGLEWLLWDPGGPVPGWELHLAVGDPHRGRSWAVAAIDPA